MTAESVFPNRVLKWLKRVFFFLGGLILGASSAASFFWWRMNMPVDPAGSAETFVVAEGESVQDIAENLEEQRIIRSRLGFMGIVWLEGVAQTLQAGEYELSPAKTPREIVVTLAKGHIRPNEVEVTFPEGVTLDDIDALLAEFVVLSRGEFRSAHVDIPYATGLFEIFPCPAEPPSSDSDNTVCSVPVSSLEGYLFPDTYRFKKDAAPSDIVLKLVTNFLKKLTPDLRAEIQRQEKSPTAIMTMASLIEEEVRTDGDRKIVSGILWKRLEAGIPLQVDATVLYAKQTSDSASQRFTESGGERELTYTDLEIDSSYNTYRYVGLPPGPIANPGLSSIKAAIFPEPSEYWYYLSAKDGITIFSRTLEEHNRAKARYLQD